MKSLKIIENSILPLNMLKNITITLKWFLHLTTRILIWLYISERKNYFLIIKIFTEIKVSVIFLIKSDAR